MLGQRGDIACALAILPVLGGCLYANRPYERAERQEIEAELRERAGPSPSREGALAAARAMGFECHESTSLGERRAGCERFRSSNRIVPPTGHISWGIDMYFAEERVVKMEVLWLDRSWP